VRVIEQRARRQPAAEAVVDREALFGDAVEAVVQQDHLAALRAEGVQVFFQQGTGQHDHAVAAAFEQEADAVDRLLARGVAPDAEGHHHVQAGAAQFGVDDLQHGGVEGAGHERDVDPDHAAAPVQQRARRVRGPVAQRGDGLAHPLQLGRRHRALAAHHARRGAQPDAGQARYVLDSRH
jgi:hypothetical protein